MTRPVEVTLSTPSAAPAGRVVAVAVLALDPPIRTLDDELGALALGLLAGDALGIGLTVEHPARPARAVALDGPPPVGPGLHADLHSRRHRDLLVSSDGFVRLPVPPGGMSDGAVPDLTARSGSSPRSP